MRQREPDLIAAMIERGWLFGEQKRDPQAVHDALSALTFQALSAGMRPAPAEQVYLPVDTRAIAAAWPWAKPGSQLSAESAGRTLGTAVKCARLAGFTPEVFSSRLQAMAAEFN